MLSNNAPKCTWESFMMSDGLKRHRLYVDSRYSRIFVDQAIQTHHRSYGKTYGVWVAGASPPSPDGHRFAAFVGGFDRLREAKLHAEQLGMDRFYPAKQPAEGTGEL